MGGRHDRSSRLRLNVTAYYADLWPRITFFVGKTLSPTSPARPNVFVNSSKRETVFDEHHRDLQMDRNETLDLTRPGCVRLLSEWHGLWFLRVLLHDGLELLRDCLQHITFGRACGRNIVQIRDSPLQRPVLIRLAENHMAIEDRNRIAVAAGKQG